MRSHDLRELAVDIDGIESRDEVNEHIVNALRHLLQECSSDFLVRRVLVEVDGDEKLFGLCIDIANINTTFVGEEDPVTLTD